VKNGVKQAFYRWLWMLSGNLRVYA